MNDRDKLRRSNMILIGIVVVFLLYGIIYRAQTGDNTLHLFGYTIELPFGTQQEEVQEDVREEVQEDVQTETQK